MLVIYSAEVVECTGYQKNILDICSSVDIPLTKGLHFDKLGNCETSSQS